MRLALPVPEAAEAIGCSQSMMWKLLEQGAINRVKIGRRTVIRVAELERFLTEQSEAPSDGSDEASVIDSVSAGSDRG